MVKINSPIPKGIPGYEFVKMEPLILNVDRCFDDVKYYAETSDGRKFSLLIAEPSLYERRKTITEYMALAVAQGVSMCRPIELGFFNGGKYIYELTTWCEGIDLGSRIPVLSEPEKYIVGINTGIVLQRLHSVSAPDGLEDWFVKYHNYLAERMYLSLNHGVVNIRIENHIKIIYYFMDNKHLLKGRPQTLRHGDFNDGNIIVSDNLDISVIDWTLMEHGHNYGDPWEEFTRLLGADTNPYFGTGLLRGYFGGEPPEELWALLALYLSAMSLIYLTHKFYGDFSQEYRDESVQDVIDTLLCFDNMCNPVPTWYLKDYIA